MCGLVPHNTSVWPACHIHIHTGPLGLASSRVHKHAALNAINPAPTLGIQDQCRPLRALGMVLVFLSHLSILYSFYFSQNDFVSIFAVGNGMYWPPGVKSKSGHAAGGTHLGTGPKPSQQRHAYWEKVKTERLPVEKICPPRKQKSKKRGEKVTRPDTNEDITELPSVPHIPIIIPDSLGTGNNIPVPPHLSDPSTPLTEIPNTGDPEACNPDGTPAPEGIVKLFLEEMLAAVKDQTKRHGQPECHNKHKTFWILQPDLWFTLEEYKYTPTLLSPKPLYRPQVFVWLPNTLLPRYFKIRCPYCDKEMGPSGWNSNPVTRRVVSLES
ncbi:hypothetical protein DFH07DRAFT_764326 [Mycena maculata]|uniref:Uncharacterized protein n=1 Tax=Mycena maculata TaxID=230809 RepID=A0AAD7KF87_9AGAR|nr:hypothetical protein DFH07DRAFT_764326 [Mycena maculata]